MVLLKNDKNTLPFAQGKSIAVLGASSNSGEDLLGNYVGPICPSGKFEVRQGTVWAGWGGCGVLVTLSSLSLSLSNTHSLTHTLCHTFIICPITIAYDSWFRLVVVVVLVTVAEIFIVSSRNIHCELGCLNIQRIL